MDDNIVGRNNEAIFREKMEKQLGDSATTKYRDFLFRGDSTSVNFRHLTSQDTEKGHRLRRCPVRVYPFSLPKPEKQSLYRQLQL